MEKLLKELVSIPSFVSEGVDETGIAKFIKNELSQLKDLTIEKQFIDDVRYNLIIRTPGIPKVLLAAHMDTVPLSSGWTKSSDGSQIDGDIFFGLGAADTKGSVAAIIEALKNLQSSDNLCGVTALFYCGEEYDFAGMKAYVDFLSDPSFEMIICGEPTNLGIGNAQRGVVEISFEIFSKTGHSGKRNGTSATEILLEVVKTIQQDIARFTHPVLGVPHLNIAGIEGGVKRGETVNVIGNMLPNIARATFEIRTTDKTLDAGYVCNEINKVVERYKDAKITKMEQLHDLGPMYIEEELLRSIYHAFTENDVEVKTVPAQERGYSDLELLVSRFNIPGCVLGPIGGNLHSADEWVSLSSIHRFTKIIESVCLAYQKT